MKKPFLSLVIAASAALTLSGCKSEENHAVNFFAMNTIMSISSADENADAALKQAQSRITELDRLWSVTNSDSELSRLNSGEQVAVNPETAELLRFSLDIAEKTDGALDPTIYPVLTAWGFTLDENRVPDKSEIAALLERVDYRNIRMDGDTVSLKNSSMLDFGAVAKGYAGDETAKILREQGITSALINLGGSITTIGKKTDGSDWKIGVKNPLDSGNVGTLALSDLSAVTSGAYERYFTAEDGTVYGHIINPATGCPADNDLLSVTIVSENATLCDALSTALFVMGSEKAQRFYRDYGSALGFEIILITKDKEVIVSPGLSSRFRLTDKSFSPVQT